jgi:hypothetical protein
MAKIQLTIKTTYLPNWHVNEGLRELVQNARDAEVEHGAKMKIEWINNTLRIENTGTILPRSALLLGHTSKLGNSSLIGKFGEGLKLGTLALLRDRYPVKIRTGDEVWEPRLEISDTFGEEVLSFHINGGREYKNRVRVEVGHISRQLWEEISETFLFLKPPTDIETVKTVSGTLLLGEKYAGKVYVKGIFVQNHSDLSFGYDLRDVELDRDRRMIESWNLQYTTRNILLNAVNQKPELLTTFYNLLEQNSNELKNIETYQVSSLSTEIKNHIIENFLTKFGEDSLPVENLEQSRSIEHLGKRGVIVSKALGAVLATKFGNVTGVIKSLENEVVETHSWASLSKEEQNNLESVLEAVDAVSPISFCEVDIVTFRSTNLFGQFKEGRTLISRRIILDYEELLATVIHEVAHEQGGDGEHSHIAELERIWKGVYSNLRKGK